MPWEMGAPINAGSDTTEVLVALEAAFDDLEERVEELEKKGKKDKNK